MAVYLLSLSALLLGITLPVTTQGTTLQLNAGGPAAPPFQADQGFTGGSTVSHPNTINTAKAVNPAPAAVYQTGRIGNFVYSLGGFVPDRPGPFRSTLRETYCLPHGHAASTE